MTKPSVAGYGLKLSKKAEEELKKADEEFIKEEEERKQKEILKILKPHLKMEKDENGLVGLTYDMSALTMKEQQLIKEWLEMTKEELKKQLLLSLEMWNNGEVLESAELLRSLANKIVKEANNENIL